MKKSSILFWQQASINSSLKATSKSSITLKATSPPNKFTKAVPKQPKSSK